MTKNKYRKEYFFRKTTNYFAAQNTFHKRALNTWKNKTNWKDLNNMQLNLKTAEWLKLLVARFGERRLFSFNLRNNRKLFLAPKFELNSGDFPRVLLRRGVIRTRRAVWSVLLLAKKNLLNIPQGFFVHVTYIYI